MIYSINKRNRGNEILKIICVSKPIPITSFIVFKELKIRNIINPNERL
jgi:hypothetical protein